MPFPRLTGLLFVLLGACSAPSPPKAAAPDPETATAIAVEDEDPEELKSEATLRDATGAMAFVRELCAAAKREDWKYVEEHTKLPLRGQEQVGESDKPLRVAGLIGQNEPEQIAHRAVCKYLKEKPAALDAFEVDDDEVRGQVSLNGQPYRLTLSLDPPRLVEQKLLIESRPPGDAKLAAVLTPFPVEVNVSGRGEDEEMEGLLSNLVQAELSETPTCALQQAARDPVSSSLSIQVRTRAEKIPRVDIYASTVTDARLLACLQSQLVPFLQKALEYPTATKVYELWTMIGIPVKDDGEATGVIMKSPVQ